MFDIKAACQWRMLYQISEKESKYPLKKRVDDPIGANETFESKGTVSQRVERERPTVTTVQNNRFLSLQAIYTTYQ